MLDGKTMVIAEAGVNHNGDVRLAKRLADEARAAGADVVKYQVFKARALASASAGKAAYQEGATGGGGQLGMLEALELGYEDFEDIAAHCASIGITFLATAFDPDSAEFLDGLGAPFWKVPSGEVTNYPFLVRVARTGKPVVMSTGMCDLAEVGEALDVLRSRGAGPVTLLHCTTEYPAPYAEVNLRAMLALREEFGCEVGYSDHTRGIEVPVAAVALGAKVIEKHFTLDRGMEGPDHAASLEPGELAAMVRAVRNVEAALGDGAKAPTASELRNRVAARKSIVAGRPIARGEALTEENLAAKRPGGGVSPMRWPEVLGTRAVRDFGEDEQIEL